MNKSAVSGLLRTLYVPRTRRHYFYFLNVSVSPSGYISTFKIINIYSTFMYNRVCFVWTKGTALRQVKSTNPRVVWNPSCSDGDGLRGLRICWRFCIFTRIPFIRFCCFHRCPADVCSSTDLYTTIQGSRLIANSSINRWMQIDVQSSKTYCIDLTN